MANEARIIRRSLAGLRSEKDQTDWARVDALTDDEIDAAIAEYVAPRSINLDLKTMLMGRDKMDTEAIGVIIVNVKSAKGFRDGDAIKMWKSKDKQSGDGYVTVGWGKWGKPMWSTR